MDEGRKYYLVLGAGENQIPLIKAAKSEGFSVIGVDRDINAAALKYCDIKVDESIRNYRKIDYKLNMGVTDGTIIGGYSGSFGTALLSWAYLAERFSLPAPSRTLMEILTDKYAVRQKLLNLEFSSFAQPKVLVFQNSVLKEDLEELGFPMIIKTREGYAKRNVYLIDKYSDIRHFLTRRHLNEINVNPASLIMESFVKGDEIIVIGLVHDFNYRLISITDKVASPEAPFIDLEHIYPSRYSEKAVEISNMHEKIVRQLQIPVGPLVSEWKIVDGKYYLIELSPQIPGEMLGNFMIPEVLHYDFYRNLVKVTTGQDSDPLPTRKNSNSGRVRYFQQKIDPDEWKSLAKKAAFAKVLNENAPETPTSNMDRFAVMGFKE